MTIVKCVLLGRADDGVGFGWPNMYRDLVYFTRMERDMEYCLTVKNCGAARL